MLDGVAKPFENTKFFGHQQQVDFLAKSYRSGRIHHAILLEGPEGIGKATLAFRFANHVLNYPEQHLAPEAITDPDEQSPVYRQIVGGASHNLIHIKCQTDPKTGKTKSAISVDDIRKTSKFFAQTSGSQNWRIAIIDVADHLNRSAANALLKILEEPPKNAMFLVLSHSPGKLLPTIRSRCLSLRLSALPNEDLVKALSHANTETQIEPQELEQLVELSEGSVARALTLINYGGTELIKIFHEILQPDNKSSVPTAHKLAETLAGKDQDVNYFFFLDYLVTYVIENAKNAAEAGDLSRADELAALSDEMQQHINNSNIYNLDKKQTILTLFSMILP